MVGTGKGVFHLGVHLSAGTGVAIMELTPTAGVIGVKMGYNGVIYNSIIRYTGELLSVPSAPIVMASQADYDACDVGVTSTHNLKEYRLVDGTFQDSGFVETITFNPSSIFKTMGAFGEARLVLQKTEESVNYVDIWIYSPCSSGSFSFKASCPISETYPIYIGPREATTDNICSDEVDMLHPVYMLGGTATVITSTDPMLVMNNTLFTPFATASGAGYYRMRVLDEYGVFYDGYMHVNEASIVDDIHICE